jgi:2-polyprenyl-3-methyl-5-hydroxy-6-metoxy-1,4-benzoquinol methylase
MECKICKSPTEKIFEKVILQKYKSAYYRCSSCSFVQTDEPVWLEEAYKSVITSLDIGILNRNVRMQQDIPKILDACFPEAKILLDYAGGYGIFTRLMRDEGFNFYRMDPYCDNIFAKHFDISDAKTTKFDVLTAFEVFEHFADPLSEIDKLFTYSDNIIFSTVLMPPTNKEIEDWWYIAQETGQHVAFYSEKTMKFLAKRYKVNYYRKDINIHVFTRKEFNKDQIDYAFNGLTSKSYLFGLKHKDFNFKSKRKSLLESDYNYIKGILNA